MVRLQPNTSSIFIAGRLTWITGITLSALGVICLYLSDQVVTGWWQGTLGAFGAGFIIGGVVDVLAVSGLAYISKTEERWLQESTLRAERAVQRRRTAEGIEQARQLLQTALPYLDERLRDEVLQFLTTLPAEPPDDRSPRARRGTG